MRFLFNLSSPDVQAPLPKAAAALGAGAGASAMSISQHAQSFLPTDLAGWLAASASAAALAYSLCLLSEWWWKKLWKPFFISRGWLRARG